MLATALGAMIFGPVMAIPAAIISDTIGFMIWPNGDYFLPFVLTEIASTMAYALCLYRAKPTTTRVMLSRFIICFFVNLILQTGIMAWQYDYLGNPEKAKDQILGIFAVARVFKNLCMFPIESVVLTLFLRMLMPITARLKLTHGDTSGMNFTAKRIVALVLLLVLGTGTATGYLFYLYGPEGNRSRSADYTTEERVEANKAMAQLVLEKTDTWDEEKVFCVVDSAYRGLLDKETDYTVSVYILDEEAFAAGQAADSKYTEQTLWGYSKSGPGKDKYGSLIKVATVKLVKVEKTGELVSWELTAVE
jgi:ECF transporter S component (folate family)